MLTSRGWWFLLIVLGLMLLSLIIEQRSENVVLVLPMALFVWFASEWARFRWRLSQVLPHLRCRRLVIVDGRPVPSLWANREAEIAVTVECEHDAGLPMALCQEILPVTVEHLDGKLTRFANPGDRQLSIRYHIRTQAVGTIRFDGIQLRLSDLQGFFYRRVCLRDPVIVPVLPILRDAEGDSRVDKKLNLLPPPGSHEHRRPGSGSELLDLRDYRPGDPPKLIAWKASARRDRLIVREYEAEVPIRCTLFVDASSGMRQGPPGNTPLQQVMELVSAVAQAAILRRDLVGMVLVREQSVTIHRPARSSQHLLQLMRSLALSSLPSNDDTPAPTTLAPLLPLAGSLAQEVYPDLLRSEVNSTPLRMYWHAALDSRWGKWLIALFASPMLLVFPWVRSQVAALAGGLAGSDRWILPIFVLLCLSPGLLALILWGLYGLQGLLPGVQFRMGQRKRLAGLLSELQSLPAGAIARMQHDDAYFSQRLQLFLQQHQIPLPPLPKLDGQADRQAGEAKIDQFCAGLSQAIARARDHELFVLLIDCIAVADQLEPLIRTLRVARARHHQIIVLCPWMDGIPLPHEPLELEPQPVNPTFRVADLQKQLRQQVIANYHRQADRVRHELARLGIAMLLVPQHSNPKLILERMERMRQPQRIG
ncbi:DUF58 domain-containing protein [Tuwongella immobilis]|uniref:DUF58 domain-containing protein n=1 Tax=Tuwongella immobilis TaxID=692036 RepID=A0A6C2YN31_9BACT|nr:DUF58 domain-containing protein [Tuwongella immobilis]VIP03018.1 Uncharacterized protein OS=Haliangium ochraceum (strain DSM 14365 / JCM 11303 / SMP-2) GN=Hoch_2373 PE=4 SV=1: DUF58 [Tuwongella immobilis]VTS03142.1 Uncharacterized protein OS=Haliangium ochraceum (strain DSM 14365 / JCM 11303 / SMP-2) GN=Hoch_2373 PE=4 SV=1: DUF58 [Tuwongella immobilis]